MSETEENQNQNNDKEDKFSDVEDNDDFQVNVNLIKNTTTTSNFKFNIDIVNPGEAKKEKKAPTPKKEFQEQKNEGVVNVEQKSSTLAKSGDDGPSSGSDVDMDGSNPQIEKGPKASDFADIYEFYQKLRDNFNETGELYEDPEFTADPGLFCSEAENPDNEFEIEFERPPIGEDDLDFFVVEPHNSNAYNIEHEFKIARGILNDKFFVGALLMLFKKKEEFFTNLVLDYEHVKENIKAGFCGFTFFYNGEWKNVTIDTRLPAHQRGEFSLSRALTTKSPYWISLFEKAYAKLYGSYSVLNNTLLKDFLVDFTGGWSKMIKIPHDNTDDKYKKFYFDEITRCVSQGYLIGCMKYEENKIIEELNESMSDKDQGEDEQIISNTIYTIADIQEYENLKLIFLVNHWEKGKFTHPYGPEDETWEANKKLTERLNYTVSTTDGTFWMLFDEFITSFNTLYYCRIFPEAWAQYTIPGVWQGETSGGSPQKNFPWIPEQRIVQKGGHKKPAADSKISGKASEGSSVIKQQNTTKKKQVNIGKSTVIPIQKDLKAGLRNSIGLDSRAALGMSSIPGGFPSNAMLRNSIGLGIDPKINYGLRNSTLGMDSKAALGISSLGIMPKATIKDSTAIGSMGNIMQKNTIKEGAPVPQPSGGVNASTIAIQGSQVGAPPQYKQPPVCEFKRNIIDDTDDAFFLNPQYKIEVKQGVKMIISLMQEDKKMTGNNYIKCNFMIVLTKGRHSRVWDVKESQIIKKALDEKDDGKRREIVMLLDFNEIIKKYNNQNQKKIPKSDKVYVNLIPYMEYTAKYEIDKKGYQRIFKPYHPEAKYWLRIFSSDDIYISEMKRPYECRIVGNWINESTSGGPRFIIQKNKYVENPYWPVNPQFLLRFVGNIRTKIILRKQGGHFANEETNVGLMITKPSYYEEDQRKLEEAKISLHQRPEKEKVKLEPIQRVIKSTNKILKTRKINFDEIFPKLSVNGSENVIESSYNNNYCASIQKTFSKLDSPVILIPTLAYRDSSYEFELTIFSTKPTEIFALYNDNCQTLIGEWNESNAGGSHLAVDEGDEGKEEAYKKKLTWMDNPKFLLQFENKDWIKDLNFEIIISRSAAIWKTRLSRSMINAMMSCYIFKNERDKWKDNLVNLNQIDFMPKNEVIITHHEERADPRGFILMPITYGKEIFGPFSIMVKCSEKFKLTPFKEK